MNWSNVPEVLAATKAPTGYELAQLGREDVPQMAAALRRWYPDIAVGAESCHLDAEFYYEKTMLAEVIEDRAVYPVVAKSGDCTVAMITFEKNNHARTITSRMGAIAPEHRGPGLALLGPILLEKIGRAIGAELAYYFATLKTPHQQILAERLRYQLVGIIPAYDRDMVRPGEVRRVYEAIYARVLVGPELVELPGPGALTARTRALWETLFGGSPGARDNPIEP
jgi:hypothetical protein